MSKLLLIMFLSFCATLASAQNLELEVAIDPLEAEVAIDLDPPQCAKNEVFKQCAGCEAVCNQHNEVCAAVCIPKCVCQKGFIRASNDGPCINARSCKACRINEEFRHCSKDKNFCDFPVKAKSKTGCYCKSGFSRKANGACVPTENCNIPNSRPDSPPRCDGGAVYTTCGTCDQECGKPDRFCTMGCKVGCFCMNGNVRNDKGECVPRERC